MKIGFGRDVHGESVGTDGDLDEVFDDHEYHRESQRHGTPADAPRVSLAGWRDGAALGSERFLNAETKFRRVSGYPELWMLENKTLLIDNQPVAELAQESKAA